MSDHARRRQAIEESVKDEPAMLTGDRVGEICGVGRRAVYEWISLGLLDAVKLSDGRSGRVRVPRAALVDFLARRAAR